MFKNTNNRFSALNNENPERWDPHATKQSATGLYRAPAGPSYRPAYFVPNVPYVPESTEFMKKVMTEKVEQDVTKLPKGWTEITQVRRHQPTVLSATPAEAVAAVCVAHRNQYPTDGVWRSQFIAMYGYNEYMRIYGLEYLAPPEREDEDTEDAALAKADTNIERFYESRNSIYRESALATRVHLAKA